MVPQGITSVSSVSFLSLQDKFRWDVLGFLLEALFFSYTFPARDAVDTRLKFDQASGIALPEAWLCFWKLSAWQERHIYLGIETRS